MALKYSDIPESADPLIESSVIEGFMGATGQAPPIGEFVRGKIVEFVLDNLRNLPGEFDGTVNPEFRIQVADALFNTHSRINWQQSNAVADSIRLRLSVNLSNDPTIQYLMQSRGRPGMGPVVSGGGKAPPPKPAPPSPGVRPSIRRPGAFEPPVPPPPTPSGARPSIRRPGAFGPPAPPPPPGFPSPPQIQPTFPGEPGYEPPWLGENPYEDLPPPPPPPPVPMPPEPEPAPATTSKKKKSSAAPLIIGIAAVGAVLVLSKR